MRTRTFFIFFGLVIFLSNGQPALASTIFNQTPISEALNGPILNSPYLVMFGCSQNLNGCGVNGKTVYNIGIWIKKIGNPNDIRLQVADTWTHYPTSDSTNFSNSISASSVSSTAYTLIWFYFPNGVVVSSTNQFFLPQFTGANNTFDRTNYYRALYDPNNSYNAPMQWCKIYLGCWSSKFFWMMDDEKIDLSLPPPPPDPCAAPGVCASNVLFLPGIEASRLYRPDYDGGTDQLWEPNIDSDVQDLYMNADGTSARNDVYTKERDVIDELPSGANIYKSFIAKMDELRTSGDINDWEPIAYDWRLSLDDILNYGHDVQGRIYYSGDLRATSTPYVIQELKRLAASSKTHRVTIVAHSNGGLLAKRLTELLGPVESTRLIDKMIFVAVPQAGTPMSIPAGLHGYEQDHVLGLVTSQSTARTFAQNSPMEYQLLPSANYFTYVDDPVVTFDASLTDWISRYGSSIHSESNLRTFLTDTYGRVDPQTGDINQPIQFNSSLLSGAEALHTSLDNWTPPAGVSLVQIAGWGVPKTVEGITYKKKGTGVTPEADFTIDGDGTVVVPSALWTSAVTASTTNYWMDLKKYSNDHWITTLGGFHPFSHANILETDPAINFLSDKITNTIKPLSNYVYLSTETPAESDKRLRYALHSPLTLNLYDDHGRHTGVSTTTGQVEEQIPGTYYTEFGDVKYLFSDASENAHIIMDGYAPGTFTFNIDQYTGDTLTASTTFKDIPTTADTMVNMDVQSDISTLSPMQIDKNGDGTADVEIAPRLNDVATFPKTPVTITAENKTILLGAPLPAFTAALSATSSDITGAPYCSVGIMTTSVVGVYPITCTIGTLASQDYDFTTFVPGTLAINYRWDGFLPPINDTAHQTGQDSVFKGGSTIPVKFRLKTSGGAPVQAATSPLWYADGVAGSAPYKWDSTAQQYVYNWSTKGFATGLHTVYAKLDDGQTYSVTIWLK